MSGVHNTVNFIYPNICYHCDQKIGESQFYLCHNCWSEIKTYKKEEDTSHLLESRLKGKVKIESIHTLYWFQKSSPLQTLLHELKYEFQPHIGVYLGKLLGEKLDSEVSGFQFTGIIPVPVHSLKQIERGYNQAEKIADGVHSILTQAHVDISCVSKRRGSESQTQKNRMERWFNLNESFSLNFNSGWLKNQSHILIIDDVITTGATIESIGKLLLDFNPKLKLSVATIAVTE